MDTPTRGLQLWTGNSEISPFQYLLLWVFNETTWANEYENDNKYGCSKTKAFKMLVILNIFTAIATGGIRKLPVCDLTIVCELADESFVAVWFKVTKVARPTED